jgi:antirestriction protein ArdC
MARTATRTRPAPTAEQVAERKAKLEVVHSELEAGVARLTGSEQWAAFLRTASRFHRYSLNNQILIWLQNPAATQVAGYQRWQELGYQVRKGESGLRIFRPTKRRITEDEAREAGKPDLAGQYKVVGFALTSVFDVSQTDPIEGKAQPLEQPGAYEAPDGEAPAGLVDGLTAQIQALGYSVEYGDVDAISPGAYGVTVYSARRVVVREGATEAHKAEVLAHELAHISCGHEHRRDETRSRREVEAESVAYTVCAHAGLNVSQASFGYVAGWAESGKEAEAVRATAELVLRAAGQIVAGLDGEGETDTAAEAA